MPNKRKANARKRAKQMEAGKKRREIKRLHKQILRETGRNDNLSNPRLSFLIERFKSLYGGNNEK